MATSKTVIGTNGNDIEFTSSAGELQLTANFLQGDDVYSIDADLSNSTIGMDGGADNLQIDSTKSSNPTIRDTTIRAGEGNDFVQVFTEDGMDSQIWGDLGDDFIQLSSSDTTYLPNANPSVDERAIYDGFVILGDNGPEGDGTQDGIDKVYIDSGVRSFNNGLVDLEGNDNSIAGPLLDDLIDAISNGDPVNLEDLGLEGMLVQAAEVFQSTFRGGDGSDVILFDSIFNPAEDTTALDSSLINGNQDADIIAIARNITSSTVQGGQGADFLLAVSGAERFTRFNGNRGADTVTVLQLISQNSSYYGGQGNDVLNSFAVESDNALYSGDLGADDINFFAGQSSNTTLSGGAGEDEIDDYSGALTFIGNVLDGGAGDDRLRQATTLIAPGVLGFGATFIGGTGADVMTGDANTQPLDPKGVEITGPGGGPYVTALDGLSRDLFSFSYGDSAINSEGVGHDTITDFDSNASFYIVTQSTNPAVLEGDPTDVFDYVYQAIDVDTTGLGELQADVINLQTAAGVDVNIKFGISGTLGGGGGAYVVNSKGLVEPGAGVDNISEFVEAGNQQAAGAALLWTQYDNAFLDTPLDIPTGIRSWLFMSDGIVGNTDGDILVALDNVGQIAATGGLEIKNGNITGILVA